MNFGVCQGHSLIASFLFTDKRAVQPFCHSIASCSTEVRLLPDLLVHVVVVCKICRTTILNVVRDSQEKIPDMVWESWEFHF